MQAILELEKVEMTDFETLAVLVLIVHGHIL